MAVRLATIHRCSGTSKFGHRAPTDQYSYIDKIQVFHPISHYLNASSLLRTQVINLEMDVHEIARAFVPKLGCHPALCVSQRTRNFCFFPLPRLLYCNLFLDRLDEIRGKRWGGASQGDRERRRLSSPGVK